MPINTALSEASGQRRPEGVRRNEKKREHKKRPCTAATMQGQKQQRTFSTYHDSRQKSRGSLSQRVKRRYQLPAARNKAKINTRYPTKERSRPLKIQRPASLLKREKGVKNNPYLNYSTTRYLFQFVLFIIILLFVLFLKMC